MAKKKAKAAPKRGRPVTTGKTPARSIRVSDANWEAWGRKAAAAGLSISEWLHARANAS